MIAEEDASATAGPEVIAADGASPSTAVGDLHFLDENAILQTVSSLIADEAHWKKAKPNAETGKNFYRSFLNAYIMKWFYHGLMRGNNIWLFAVRKVFRDGRYFVDWKEFKKRVYEIEKRG